MSTVACTTWREQLAAEGSPLERLRVSPAAAQANPEPAAVQWRGRMASQSRLLKVLFGPPTGAAAREREFCRQGADILRRVQVLFNEGFTFRNFVADAFAIFMFVLWFWLFVSVVSDLFRRHDLSGWAKVFWVIALILFSYIGIFAYILTQGRGMAERNQARGQQARDEFFQVAGLSAADEIEKLDRLKAAGSISEQEYARLRARVVGG